MVVQGSKSKIGALFHIESRSSVSLGYWFELRIPAQQIYFTRVRGSKSRAGVIFAEVGIQNLFAGCMVRDPKQQPHFAGIPFPEKSSFFLLRSGFEIKGGSMLYCSYDTNYRTAALFR